MFSFKIVWIISEKKNLIGGGAFCNGQKIHASQTDQVNGSLHTFLLFAIVVGFLQPIVLEIHRQDVVLTYF